MFYVSVIGKIGSIGFYAEEAIYIFNFIAVSREPNIEDTNSMLKWTTLNPFFGKTWEINNK